jgi:hypothetical protein
MQLGVWTRKHGPSNSTDTTWGADKENVLLILQTKLGGVVKEHGPSNSTVATGDACAMENRALNKLELDLVPKTLGLDSRTWNVP